MRARSPEGARDSSAREGSPDAQCDGLCVCVCVRVAVVRRS